MAPPIQRFVRVLLATAFLAAMPLLAAPQSPGRSGSVQSPGELPAIELARPAEAAGSRLTLEGPPSAPVPGAPTTAPVLEPGEVGFSDPALPNFHRVDDNLLRGGQPGAGGLAKLKALGVRSILNLRYERRQSQAEEAAAKAEGLRYFNIPMYGLVRPAQTQIARALALIDDPQNRPLFVHCERGSDRTGVVVACYRVASAKWTAKQAIDEAMTFGMYRAEVAKRLFVKEFYKKLAG